MKLYIWRNLFHTPQLLFRLVSLSVLLGALVNGMSYRSPAFAQSQTPHPRVYGLGIFPKLPSAGQSRCADLRNIVYLDLLAPKDGAKTIAPYPTFYWHIDHKSINEANETNETNTDKSFYVDFILREGSDIKAKMIFRSRSESPISKQSGLYRFTLPQNAPPLQVGKTYMWQIRYTQSVYGDKSLGDQINTRAIVKLETNASVTDKIKDASTDLDKARIFAQNLYWYDALDAYTQWIDTHPHDPEALSERLSMLDQIVEPMPKLKCPIKANLNNAKPINSKQSTQPAMK